jgi:hypothetical protein
VPDKPPYSTNAYPSSLMLVILIEEFALYA